MAVWVLAALVLLAPLVAKAPWTGSDFAFASLLLFVPLSIYELVVRKSGDPDYRMGAGVALVAALLLLWVSGAAGITDSEVDVLYLLALAVGVIGAVVARFEPRGMARAMFATAFALSLAGAGALIAGLVAAHTAMFEVLGITGVFATLFVGSAWLFRNAARREPERGVG